MSCLRDQLQFHNVGRYNHTTQKQATSLSVRGNTLKEGKGIADTVRCSSSKLRWIEKWVNADDLLKESSHDT